MFPFRGVDNWPTTSPVSWPQAPSLTAARKGNQVGDLAVAKRAGDFLDCSGETHDDLDTDGLGDREVLAGKSAAQQHVHALSGQDGESFRPGCVSQLHASPPDFGSANDIDDDHFAGETESWRDVGAKGGDGNTHMFCSRTERSSCHHDDRTLDRFGEPSREKAG
jgi:hypothetical protein